MPSVHIYFFAFSVSGLMSVMVDTVTQVRRVLVSSRIPICDALVQRWFIAGQRLRRCAVLNQRWTVFAGM